MSKWRSSVILNLKTQFCGIQQWLWSTLASSYNILLKSDKPLLSYGRKRCFTVWRLECYFGRMVFVFTARYTLVQSAVLRSHVVCLSVSPSVRLPVTLVDCDHIGWNSSKIISPLVSLGCSLFATPTWRVCSKGNPHKFGPKVTHPCWFERRRHSIANCGRMVTDSAAVTMESL